ncbi:hypothetical protein EIP86_009966 [Pleurotus ostreatoroseus]|nr:hypothetical protein EIP86_009966 [Pleurotus ostreatoroseus]
MDTPLSYLPGRPLRIRCENGYVALTVVQPFLPFTTSQVLLTRLEEATPIIPLPVGSYVVAKVYDTRYIHHRTVFGKPWSRAAEEAAAQRHCGVSKPGLQMPLAPETDDAVDWEEFYYRQSTAMFWNEVQAYDRLQVMQDLSIPRLYATGSVDVADTAELRAITSPVLLMQHITDVQSLENLDAHLISRPLLESALQTVQRFTMLGVLHGDMKASEILCYPARRPMHAFIVDFGNARIRGKEERDEQWAEAVLEAGDFRCVESLFHLHAERGIAH